MQTLTDRCLQIGQPLLKLLLQVEFFFGITFGEGRQQEAHSHGSATHAEEHGTGQLTDVQGAVEADSMAVQDSRKAEIEMTVTHDCASNGSRTITALLRVQIY